MTRLPDCAGISLKPQHFRRILEERPPVGWFEIHPENYMGAGGPPHHYLDAIRSHYPLSMHGVGLSLGSHDGLDPEHLQRLVTLVRRYEPEQVSEHLAWSRFGEVYLNDLLPLPYNADSLQCLSDNIDHTQEALGRTILIENPSTYVDYADNTWSEPDFLGELVKRTGCGLLLDVNNVHVSAVNQGFDARAYLERFPYTATGEIHLAGHTREQVGQDLLLIDDHGSPVVDAVWALHDLALGHIGRPLPVLIEWDTDVPELPVLLEEARRADLIASRHFRTSSALVAA